MKPNIYYSVETTLYRDYIGDKLNFLLSGKNLSDFIISDKKEFIDQNPIIARTNALNYYQSYIEILLEAKNKEFVNDNQSRNDLRSYFNSGNDIEFGNSQNKFYISDDWDKGIEVYLNIDSSAYSILKREQKNKILIHGISNYQNTNEESNYIKEVLDGLIREFSLYSEYKYDCQGYIVEFSNNTDEKCKILRTPFDWSKYYITILR